jgi:hypothetical protein
MVLNKIHRETMMNALNYAVFSNLLRHLWFKVCLVGLVALSGVAGSRASTISSAAYTWDSVVWPLISSPQMNLGTLRTCPSLSSRKICDPFSSATPRQESMRKNFCSVAISYTRVVPVNDSASDMELYARDSRNLPSLSLMVRRKTSLVASTGPRVPTHGELFLPPPWVQVVLFRLDRVGRQLGARGATRSQPKVESYCGNRTSLPRQ